MFFQYLYTVVEYWEGVLGLSSMEKDIFYCAQHDFLRFTNA